MLENLNDYTLGESTGTIALSLREENRLATLALVGQAKRSIYIFSHQLDPYIYGDKDFLEAIIRLATRSRHSKIYLLVQNTQPMIKHGHRIIEISRRLSSYIKIRKVSEEFKDYHEDFLIVDETGLIHRKIATRYEGFASFNARREAKILIKFFDNVWIQSEPEPKLRHLHI